MGAVAVPILEGMLDEWKADIAEVTGPKLDDFRDLNKRHGLTRHRAYLAPTPEGEYWVIAVHDGPGGDTFMQTLAESQHPFDKWFKDHIGRVHGIDFEAPPPGPMPELKLDVGQ